MGAPAQAAPPRVFGEGGLEENGDWEAYPFMVHIPIGLTHVATAGSLDELAGPLGDNAGPYTSFELGAGVRVRRVVVDLMFALSGAPRRDGAAQRALGLLGYEPSSVLRLFAGLDAAYYPVRTETWAPWVGGRLGYESLGFFGRSGERLSFDYSYSGLYLAARAGVDWRATGGFGLGPYLELGFGPTLSASATETESDNPITSENEASSVTTDVELQGAGAHVFFGAGLRLVVFP